MVGGIRLGLLIQPDSSESDPQFEHKSHRSEALGSSQCACMSTECTVRAAPDPRSLLHASAHPNLNEPWKTLHYIPGIFHRRHHKQHSRNVTSTPITPLPCELLSDSLLRHSFSSSLLGGRQRNPLMFHLK